MELLNKNEGYTILGACFEVYKEEGNGFVEPVYQECLELESGFQKIPFSAQSVLGLAYNGVELKQHYIPDFLCCEKIIVELKAARELTDEHRA